ncbi:hypothetical protein SXCC_01011 [Gluconacetobacter sp. SXCC-1]|nr:hypothetical protein SXCC_01011 [Gluconacetobacter sp. SXCC-1]
MKAAYRFEMRSFRSGIHVAITILRANRAFEGPGSIFSLFF